MKAKGKGRSVQRSSFSKQQHDTGRHRNTKKTAPRPKYNDKPTSTRPPKKFRKDNKDKSTKSASSKSILKPAPKVLTNREKNTATKKENKDSDALNKIVIHQLLKQPVQNAEKISQHLARIKSRGLIQRLKNKFTSLKTKS